MNTTTIERIETILYKKDNNLDKMDNLDDLPSAPAVYAICGRINGKPVNCRRVGEADNLQKAIKTHFSLEEPDPCLKQFMQSIKIKSLVYQVLHGVSPADRSAMKKQWEDEYKPDCNEELNKVH